MQVGEVFPEWKVRCKVKHVDEVYLKMSEAFATITDHNDTSQILSCLNSIFIRYSDKEYFGSYLVALLRRFWENEKIIYILQAAIELGAKLLNGLHPGGAVTENELVQTFFLAAWLSSGRRVYEVNQSLIRYLRYTKLHGLSGDDLRLPYPALYIQIPLGVFKLHDPHGSINNIIGCYVIESPLFTSDTRMWSLAPVTDSSVNSHLAYEVFLSKEVSPEDSLKKTLMSAVSNTSLPDAGKRDIEEIFFYVMNVVIYATNVTGATTLGLPLETQDLTSRLKNAGKDRRSKIRRRLDDASYSSHFILRDNNIEVDRTTAEDNLSDENDLNTPKRVLTVRTLVTGHWRRQACGSGHLERKLIWIRPFWRGPDGAVWIHHTRRILKATSLNSPVGAAEND